MDVGGKEYFEDEVNNILFYKNMFAIQTSNLRNPFRRSMFVYSTMYSMNKF